MLAVKEPLEPGLGHDIYVKRAVLEAICHFLQDFFGGTQLGFHRPEDWAGLRAADVLRHRGKGLLKQFQFRIAPLVREYLASRSVPTSD